MRPAELRFRWICAGAKRRHGLPPAAPECMFWQPEVHVSATRETRWAKRDVLAKLCYYAAPRAPRFCQKARRARFRTVAENCTRVACSPGTVAATALRCPHIFSDNPPALYRASKRPRGLPASRPFSESAKIAPSCVTATSEEPPEFSEMTLSAPRPRRPAGTTDNSPAFQRWVRAANGQVPQGRQKQWLQFCRPCGTRFLRIAPQQ